MKFQISYHDSTMHVLKEEEVEASAFEDVLTQVSEAAISEIDGTEVAGLSIIPDGQF